MSDKIKMEKETQSLLEEADDLSIGAEAGGLGGLAGGFNVVSSAMPNPITLNGKCHALITETLQCKILKKKL